MKGSINQRANGSWEYRFDLGPDPLTGKRRQTTKSGFRTRRECAKALREAMAAADTGRHVAPTRTTVADFLATWLPARRPTLRPNTWVKYRYFVDSYVNPVIGQTSLQELTPVRLNLFYAHLLERGRVNVRPGQSQGLSASTVVTVHQFLSTVMGDAVTWGYLMRNPVSDARPPRVGRAPLAVWTPEQLRAFVAHVREHRLYALWLLVVTTGLRRGEMAGLRPEDVDLTYGTICPALPRVVVDGKAQDGELKTDAGRRTLSLDPMTLAALSAHIDRWRAERAEYGHDATRLFCHPDGTSIHPDTITDWFQGLAKQAGLPVIRLHGVRHSYATAAIKAGVHPKIVAARLGHTDESFTMKTYGHLLPGMDQDAANLVAALILGPRDADVRTSARTEPDTSLPAADDAEGGRA